MNTKGQMGRKKKSLLLSNASRANDKNSDSFNPRNLNNITKMFLENPNLTVKEYNKLTGANLDIKDFQAYRRSLLKIRPRLKVGKNGS